MINMQFIACYLHNHNKRSSDDEINGKKDVTTTSMIMVMTNITIIFTVNELKLCSWQVTFVWILT